MSLADDIHDLFAKFVKTNMARPRLLVVTRLYVFRQPRPRLREDGLAIMSRWVGNFDMDTGLQCLN